MAKRGVGESGLRDSYAAAVVAAQQETITKLKRQVSDDKYDAKRPPVAGRVEPEIRGKLEAIAGETGVPLAAVVEQALEFFCQEYDAGRINLGVKEIPQIERKTVLYRNES